MEIDDSTVRNRAVIGASRTPGAGRGVQILVKPTVLLATTSGWIPSARLAMALAQAGFLVDALCPSWHPLCKTRAVHQTFSYRGLAPISSFKDAITDANPDLIVPADDLATKHLHQLYLRESAGRMHAASASTELMSIDFTVVWPNSCPGCQLTSRLKKGNITPEMGR